MGTLQVLGITLISLASVFILVSWNFLYWFRNHPIVAMGQPKMLSVLCLGAMLMVIAKIFHLKVRDAPESENFSVGWYNLCCSLYSWFFILGLMTVQTVLLCKLYRVYQVMQFQKGRVIRAHQVMWPLGVVLLLVIGAMIAIQILYPPEYHIVIVPGYETAVGWCFPNQGTSMRSGLLARVIVEQALGFLLTLVMVGLAWKLRSVNEELGESRRILYLNGAVLLVLLLYWTFFLVVQHANVGNLDAVQLAVWGGIAYYVFWFSMIVLYVGVPILPRMYYVWYEHSHGHLPAHVNLPGRAKVRVVVNHSPTPTARTKIEVPEKHSP